MIQRVRTRSGSDWVLLTPGTRNRFAAAPESDIMINQDEKICPRCDAHKIKAWAELSDEQKMLVERLPLSAEFTLAQRKKHRFCTRCWFEESDRNSTANT